jgi:hypothetical protein
MTKFTKQNLIDLRDLISDYMRYVYEVYDDYCFNIECDGEIVVTITEGEIYHIDPEELTEKYRLDRLKEEKEMRHRQYLKLKEEFEK